MKGERSYPVFVEVTTAGDRPMRVRVGSAVASNGGFLLELNRLAVALPSDPGPPKAVEPQQPSPSPVGAPGVAGLEALAERARKVLADPRKARWHEHERMLLEEIEAEIARKRGLASAV